MAQRIHPGDTPGDVPGGHIGPMSFEAYLAFLERTEWRYEYMNGMAYAMAGAAHVHEAATLNVATRLRALARGSGCTVTSQGFLVRTPRGDAYLPDAMLGCGPRPANHDRYLTDPCLVVEVLSPSTMRVDLGEKRIAYQEIPTLRAYLVIETAWRAVHRMWREADDTWQRETIADASGGMVPLPCPAGATLTLDEIYEDVALPTEPPRATRVFEQPETTTAGAS